MTCLLCGLACFVYVLEGEDAGRGCACVSLVLASLPAWPHGGRFEDLSDFDALNKVTVPSLKRLNPPDKSDEPMNEPQVPSPDD